MTNTYYIIFIVMLVSAIVFLIAGAVMFFLFNIPKIIGLLTGFTARKQIRSIQKRDIVADNSNHLDTFMNEQRNIAQQVKQNDNANNQHKYNSAKSTNNAVHNTNETEVIENNTTTETISLETVILPYNETQQNTSAENMPETTYLENNSTEDIKDNSENIRFNIIFSLDFINTDEVI